MLSGTIVEDAYHQLRSGNLTTDVLLMAGVLAAFVYSLVSVATGAGHIYFEVVCMVLVAVTFGRWLEANGNEKVCSKVVSSWP